MRVRLLLFTNIVTAALLGWLLLHGRLHPRTRAAAPAYQTTAYREQTEFYPLYNSSTPKIVMLGTSLTARVQWNELLGRTDVVARGINGDLTAGMLARVDEVIRLNPEV